MPISLWMTTSYIQQKEFMFQMKTHFLDKKNPNRQLEKEKSNTLAFQ